MKNKLITLGGLIENPEIAMDWLLAHYYTTVNSQSVLHSETVYSLVGDLASGGSNYDLESKITSSVMSLFSHYFNNPEVVVQLTGDPSSISLNIYVSSIVDGLKVDASSLRKIKNGKVSRLSNVNVSGDV